MPLARQISVQLQNLDPVPVCGETWPGGWFWVEVCEAVAMLPGDILAWSVALAFALTLALDTRLRIFS